MKPLHDTRNLRIFDFKHIQKFNFKEITIMPKNYTKEHYAINKYRKGIVYRGVDGNYEITVEGFLQEIEE